MKHKNQQAHSSLSTGAIHNSHNGEHQTFQINTNSPQFLSIEYLTSVSPNLASSSNILSTGNISTQITNNSQSSPHCITETNCLSPSFNNSTILTRSAAVRQKQQQQLQLQKSKNVQDVALLVNSSQKQKSSGLSHQYGGKIVKPIPVRPISSSASSTHSSSGAQTAQTTLQNILKSEQNDQMSQFSLIAKYFASFPATRLKNSHQETQETITNPKTISNTNILISGPDTDSNFPALFCSDDQSTNHLFLNTTKAPKTRFLPFKHSIHCDFKQQNQNQQYHISKQIMNSTGEKMPHSNILKISCETHIPHESTGLSNKLGIKPINSSIQKHYNPSTDLCTNFKRLIKLTDTTPVVDLHHKISASSLASISRSSSKTPTQNEDDSDSGLSKTRLGQIQMETRSTRKFLIKHHPYLQNSNQQQHSLQKDSKDRQQRPSINFIKMKRLKKKAAARAAVTQIQDSSSLDIVKKRSVKRSCRIDSYSNQETGGDTLLKFTDTAPLPCSVQNQESSFTLIPSNLKKNHNILQSHCLQQKHTYNKISSTSMTNSSKSNRLIKPIINETQQITITHDMSSDGAVFYKPLEPVRARISPTIYIGGEELNEHQPIHSHSLKAPSLTCFKQVSSANFGYTFDESKNEEIEEHSSGYYSSYQSSSDIISSSGASNGGDLLNRQPPSVNCSSKHIATKPNPNSNIMTPNHHYHTRYLSNFLNHQNSSQNQQQSISESKLTPPCTRLRHHQQMLAAAISNNVSSNDLDIDLIEND